MQNLRQIVRAARLVQQAERSLQPSSLQTLSRVCLQLHTLQRWLSESALNIPLGRGAANSVFPSNPAYEQIEQVHTEERPQHRIRPDHGEGRGTAEVQTESTSPDVSPGVNHFISRPERHRPYTPGAHQEINGQDVVAPVPHSPDQTMAPVEVMSIPVQRMNPGVQRDKANHSQTQDKRRTTAIVARVVPAAEPASNARGGKLTADPLAMRSDGPQSSPPRQQLETLIFPRVQRTTIMPTLQPKTSSAHDVASIQMLIVQAPPNKTLPPSRANIAPPVESPSRTAKSRQLGLYPKSLRGNQRVEERLAPAFSASHTPEPRESESATREPPQQREVDEPVPGHALDENVYLLAEQLEYLLHAEARRHGIEI